MAEIRIDLGDRSYMVYVERGIVRRADSLLNAAGFEGLPLFIVTDDNVAQGQRGILEALQDLPGRRSMVAVLPAGEESKNIGGFSYLLDQLAGFEEGSGALVVAFGGGVIGDLAGFVAACYKRGTPWIQVPTTLLAQVDASVGGKTAINHATAKNLIGAFHQPAMVLADMDCLSTLPARELRSGLAEVIKHGVIADFAFFERIEATIEEALERDPEVLEDYVATSCRIKGAAVEADERDTTGRRAFLNYGHTFGHAIELAVHFQYAHGEAIAIGMCCAGDMAVQLGLLLEEDAARIEAVISQAGLPRRAVGLSLEDVMAAMKLDKKFQRGQNRFILARKIGAVELKDNIPEGLIRTVVQGRMEG